MMKEFVSQQFEAPMTIAEYFTAFPPLMSELPPFLPEGLELTASEIGREAVKLADGVKVSIQDTAYPRTYSTRGESVEIGFPSRKDELLTEFAEDPKRPTQTVYCWVPLDIAEQYVAKHGGIVATAQVYIRPMGGMEGSL